MGAPGGGSKVLEACVDVCVELYCRGLWISIVGGDRVLEACRMVVGTMKDTYEMSQGAKKKGRYQPPHGGWYLPMEGLC